MLGRHDSILFKHFNGHLWIPSLIPEETLKKYHLSDKIHNDDIYTKIRKGMYGLPQAVIIYYTQINRHLSPFGYKPCWYTPGLWGHETRDINLCLVVNDFGIKYTSDNNLQHIHSDLRKNYNIGGYERRYLLRNYVKMGLQKTQIPSSSQTKHKSSRPDTCTGTLNNGPS